MTALDIAPVIQGVMLADLEAADEVRCEEDHIDSHCTVTVRWSRPTSPCGCDVRHLVCQGSWDFMFRPDCAHYTHCSSCKAAFPTPEWRKGWYPV